MKITLLILYILFFAPITYCMDPSLVPIAWAGNHHGSFDAGRAQQQAPMETDSNKRAASSVDQADQQDEGATKKQRIETGSYRVTPADQLRIAFQTKDKTSVAALLEIKPFEANKDIDGVACLQAALKKDNADFIEIINEFFPQLLNQKEEYKDSVGTQLLYQAVRDDKYNAIECLINLGVDVQVKTNGRPLLHTAIFFDNVKMLSYLWHRCPQLSTELDKNGDSVVLYAITQAIENKKYACLKFFLRQNNIEFFYHYVPLATILTKKTRTAIDMPEECNRRLNEIDMELLELCILRGTPITDKDIKLARQIDEEENLSVENSLAIKMYGWAEEYEQSLYVSAQVENTVKSLPIELLTIVYDYLAHTPISGNAPQLSPCGIPYCQCSERNLTSKNSRLALLEKRLLFTPSYNFEFYLARTNDVKHYRQNPTDTLYQPRAVAFAKKQKEMEILAVLHRQNGATPNSSALFAILAAIAYTTSSQKSGGT